MTSQQRLAAAAAVLSWVVLGIGCQDQQQTNPAVTSTPDGGSKKPDAAAPDNRGGTHDAAPDYSSVPPTTGAAGTGGSTTRPAGTGGTPTPTAGTTLRIAAIGDYGENVTEEQQVADLVHGWKPDLVITLGDNNYQSGAASTIDANIGKYYHDFIGAYHGSYGAGSPSNRFWPSPGNHDWVAPNLKPYTDYFTLPNNERYYDVDLGLVHLFAMDSDEHEPDGNTATSKQALWLKDRMTASTACYDLVYFHYPAYSSGDHGSSTELRWPFEAWGADAVLSGHDHDYERFQIGGIPYFTNGLGAAGIYKFTKSPLAETKFRYDVLHGAMLITATTTGITFEFWSHDGKKIDSTTVPKTCR